jgi:hypothetical protein
MVKRSKFLFATALLSLGLVARADAAVLIAGHPPGPGVPDPTAQIHNTGSQTNLNTVTGITVPGGVLYDFSSPTALSINGAGHATVEAFAGTGWHELTLTPQDYGYAFTAIDFNLNVDGVNRSNPFYVDIVATLVGGGTELLDNVELGNGQNKFYVYGDSGELIQSLTFTGWRDTTNITQGYIIDIRQVDVDSMAYAPEPASWAMMIAGFGLIGASMRRRKGQAKVRFAF